MAGCANVQVPVLKGVRIESVRMTGLTSAELELVMDVDNPNNRPVSVDKMKGVLRTESTGNIAEFILLNPPVCAAEASVSSCNVTLAVTITDPLAVLTSGTDIWNLNLDSFLIDADVYGALGGMKKKYRIEGYPARNLASYLK